ncbi:MAG: hypothetical protein K0R05_4550 [Anaerocolumna sp.]|nr:hypothetical protein [Anaerocolumna sp.]
MSEENLSRSEILKLIAEKKISAKEGLHLLKENKLFDEVQNPASHLVTKTFQSCWEESELILHQSFRNQRAEEQNMNIHSSMNLFTAP